MTALQQEDSTLQSVEEAGAGECGFSSGKEGLEQKTLPDQERYGEGDILTPEDHFKNKLVAVQYDKSGTIKMSVDHLPLHQTMPVHYMSSPSVPQLNFASRVYNRKYTEITPRISSPSTPSMRMTYYQTPPQKTKEDLFISELDQRINKLQNTMEYLKKEMKDDRHMRRDARNHYQQKYMPWISSRGSMASTPSQKLTKYASPRTLDWLPSPTDEPLPQIPKLPPRDPNTKPLIEGLPISPSPEDIFTQDEILQNRPKFTADVFKRKLYELEELYQNELVRIQNTAQSLKKKSSVPCNYWPQNSFNKTFMDTKNQSESYLLKSDTTKISQFITPKDMFHNFEKNQNLNFQESNCLTEELNNSNNHEIFSSKITHEIYNISSFPTTRDAEFISKSSLEGPSLTDSELGKNDLKSLYSKQDTVNTDISKRSTKGLDEALMNPDIIWETSAERFRQILNSRDDVDLNLTSEPASDFEKNNPKSIYSKQMSLSEDISKRRNTRLDEDSLKRSRISVEWETSANKLRQILNTHEDANLIYPSTTSTNITMTNGNNQKMVSFKSKIINNLKDNVEPSKTANVEVKNLPTDKNVSENSIENKNEIESNLNTTINPNSTRELAHKIEYVKKENEKVFLEDLSEKCYSNPSPGSFYDPQDSYKSNSSSSDYRDGFDSRPKKHISRREKSRYSEINSDKPSNSKSKLYHSPEYDESSSDSGDSFKDHSNSSSSSS